MYIVHIWVFIKCRENTVQLGKVVQFHVLISAFDYSTARPLDMKTSIIIKRVSPSSTRDRDSTLARLRGGDRFILKDVKNSSYCYYVMCATLIVRVGEMSWPKTGATHYYHAQLGLSDRDRAIKELVVCYCFGTQSQPFSKS